MSEGTGDRAIRYCFYCREMEHGTAPCPIVIATRQIAAAQAEAESWHRQMQDREETLLRVGSERDAALARIGRLTRVLEVAVLGYCPICKTGGDAMKQNHADTCPAKVTP